MSDEPSSKGKYTHKNEKRNDFELNSSEPKKTKLLLCLCLHDTLKLRHCLWKKFRLVFFVMHIHNENSNNMKCVRVCQYHCLFLCE